MTKQVMSTSFFKPCLLPRRCSKSHLVFFSTEVNSLSNVSHQVSHDLHLLLRPLSSRCRAACTRWFSFLLENDQTLHAELSSSAPTACEWFPVFPHKPHIIIFLSNLRSDLQFCAVRALHWDRRWSLQLESLWRQRCFTCFTLFLLVCST